MGRPLDDLAMIDRHALEVLDFERIRALLAEGARTPQGVDLCRRLAPAPNPAAAREVLADVGDVARLEPDLGLPPVAGVEAVEDHLAVARREGTCLPVDALVAVGRTLGAIHRVLEYLEDADAEGSPLGRYARQLRPLYPLADRFERTFGHGEEVLDGASPRLGEIRSEIRSMRGRISRTLEVVLRSADLEPAVQDEFVTVRGGRYVIPLRTDFRGYLKGIVHDRSRTGATFFVEPLEVVELNNRFGGLVEEEADEIRRILVGLTRWLGQAGGPLRGNLAVVAHMDGLAARHVLARRFDAVAPEVVDEPVLELRAARHPLLLAGVRGAKVVPIDLRLDADRRLLLVTGANAGGKTVALKTAGLLTTMAHSGLFVPAAEGSRVGWFSPLFADIGDEQDIDRHRSTFSGHAENLRTVLAEVGPGALVLLDELGAGTDPREGAALAMAVLEELLDRGAHVVATTHLEGLKAFAHTRADADNAAVGFDPDTGVPLYRLVYGQSGTSNALDVAERLGFPEKVIARARRYVQGTSEPGAGLLHDLDLARQEAERAAAEAEVLRRTWATRIEDQRQWVESARRERDGVRAEARADARRVIEDARRALAREIGRFARGEGSQQQVQRVLHAETERMGQALAPEVEPKDPTFLEGLQPGMRVRVASVSKDGVVETVPSGADRVGVRVGGLLLTVECSDLAPSETLPSGSAPVSGGGVRVEAEGGAADCKVVGFRVDEARRRVEQALDRALLAGLCTFQVVHGRGTGALRSAVRELLDDEPRVAAWMPEQSDAATRVEMR